MANTTCILNGGAWASGPTWSNGIPGTSDKAIIPDKDHVPAAPASDTTIHDIDATGGGVGNPVTLNASAHLTISHTVTLDAYFNLQTKSQTTSGQAIGVGAGCTFSVVTSAAGNITRTGDQSDDGIQLAGGTFSGTCLLGAYDFTQNQATFTGSVTVIDGSTLGPSSDVSFGSGGHLLIPGGPLGVIAMGFNSGSTLEFTGSAPAYVSVLTASSAAIVAAGDLFFEPIATAQQINVTSSTVTVGGNCLALLRVDSGGSPIFASSALILTSTVFHGPNTTGNFLLVRGETGAYTTDGFEPLYKVGAAGSVTSSRGSGSLIILPPNNKVEDGFTYGVDDGEEGTLPAGGVSTSHAFGLQY